VARVAVEDEQGVVHVLPIVAVVAYAFLLAMRGVVRPIEVQHNPLRRPGALALTDIQVDQGGRQGFNGVAIDGILQPGEGGLTRACLQS
jgi:hypothetical protein